MLLLLSLGKIASAQSIHDVESNYLAQLQRLAQAAAGPVQQELLAWPLRERDDQVLACFLNPETPQDPGFAKLRQHHCLDLLELARSAAASGDHAEAYRLFWRAAREDSANQSVLKALGLPATGKYPMAR